DERLGVHAECLGVRFAPNRVTLEAGAGPHAVTFTARKPPAVDTRQHVRFVDARGEPVTEVRAAIYGADGQAPVAASSDARGHIAFDLHIAAGAHGWLYLRDGRWLIRSTGPLASPGDNHRFVVDPDAPLELELMPACSVAGRLLRPDGQPAAFARVELQREVGGHWQRLAKATSTANGDFACNQLRPHLGRLRIAVRCHHGTLAEEHERLTLADEGARVQLGELRLAPPAIVTGVLRRADGSPDAGRFVSLHGKGDADDYQEDTLTDAQGRFRFVGVAPGAGELYVRRGGGTRTPYQVAAGEAVEVTPK
ncbi:MAG: carboxypeptidase regulatory-like domain-containing protein, partial [Planctomycetes bacterium]|nr:carboxypeptidase regulatory-like domain-containing protein [Planctomycetota bacterium]